MKRHVYPQTATGLLAVAMLIVLSGAGCGGGGDSPGGTTTATSGSSGATTGTATSDSGDSTTTTTTTVASGSWGTPAVVSAAASTEPALSLYLASPAAGEAFAVWLQKDLSRQRVMAARMSGGSWGAPEALDADTGRADAVTPCGLEVGGEPCVPSVAGGATGEAFAVWQQFNGGRVRILSAHYSSAGWLDSGALDLATLSANPSAPIVMSRGAGQAFAAWIQSDGNMPRAYAAVYSGGRWGDATAVDQVGASEQVWTIALATSGGGEAFLLWSQGAVGGGHSVVAARYSSNSWGAPQILDGSTGIADDGNADTTEGAFPQITSGADGSAFAVWFHTDSDQVRRVYASRFAESSWSSAAAIDPGVNSVATTPIVTSGSASQAFAVWSQHDGTAKRVWQSQFVAGNWQAPRKISSLDRTDEVMSAPLVSTGAAGEAYVIWEQSDGASLRSWANVFAGEVWGTAATIDADPPHNGVSGSFVVSGGSKAALAGWIENDGASSKIYAALFTSGN